MIRRISSFIIPVLFLFSCSQKIITEKASMDHIQTQLNKLAPVTLTADLSYLPAEEVQTLKLLVKASEIMDRIFLKQVGPDNEQILQELTASNDPNNAPYLDYFKIMFGPWDRLEEDKPFINSILKPDGANFYPLDMTKNEMETWIKNHPDQANAFESNFTMVRRQNDGLTAIPYSQFFHAELTKATKLLQEAAEITIDPTLKKFLKARADAFLNDDYYQSDMDWMDLAGDIEAVISPYEVYEDKLFGYKAAFEAFICVVDHEQSDKQKEIGSYLNDMEDHLPIPDKYKNFERGSSSPIKVVNLLFSAGDTKAGIQTTAFNLPNDERVREAKGSKKVMLKNVMNAKYDKCWIPIVNTVLAPKDLKRVSFDGYFLHVLMHEVSHGLGPGKIEKDGKKTTVNKELKETYPTIEECKADVLGVYNSQFMIDKKVFPKELEDALYASNLGGMFRSIRFGIDEAHGGGVAIQLNYYMDAGAVEVDEKGLFSVNDREIKKAVKNLAEELLMIEAKGDYDAAVAFIEKYRYLKPEVTVALDNLKDVPIDIRPVYPIESEIE